MATTDKKPFHVTLAEKLIDQLEQGTAPWQKPWSAGTSYLPYNPVSGKNYKGINSLQLLSEERGDPRWMTYKQAAAEGAQVRKGEKGTQVQYWKFEDERNVTDELGKPVLDEKGEAKKEKVKLEQPRVFLATVFNAEQIDGLPPLERTPPTWDPLEAAEARLKFATVKNDQVDRAFYSRVSDEIHMPTKSQFTDANSYYQVALHEMAHWTGHPTRMNREGGNPFGSPEYAREELRAEISSLLIGAEIGIGHEPGVNSAAYVSSWVKDLKEQPLEIFRAAAEAEKIRKMISDLTTQQELLNSQPQQPLVSNVEKAVRQGEELQSGVQEKVFLAVPYGERNAAKALGAKWDGPNKSWYAIGQEAAEKLSRWMPDNQAKRADSILPPRDELAAALKTLGFKITGKHPIMDSKPHRVAVEGDRQGEAAGFYVGYSNGHPAAYAKNNRSGVDIKWKAKGYTLTDEQKSVLAAQAAINLQERAQQTNREHIDSAKRIELQLRGATQATSTPYLEAKKVKATTGVYADKEHRSLLIPGFDTEGRLWTAQYINEDGTKRFAKGSKKEGCFHSIGGLKELQKSPAIVITEGYATANTVSEALGRKVAVVSAFDAGNLEPVAKALRAKFPDKAILIAGDDDRSADKNPGREQAIKAARAVGGEVVLPVFASGEQARDPKRFSDFNDIKTNSALGMEGLREQIESAVEKTLQQQVRERVEQREPVLARQGNTR